MIKRLIKITTKNPDPVFVTIEWRRGSIGTIFCEECKKINYDIFPRPIDIVLTEPLECMIANTPANAGAIDFFHKDFVAQIKHHLKDFVFGKCLLPNGTVIEDYVTLYCKHWIFQRGNKQSKYNICTKCGSISPNGEYGRQYIIRSCLTDASVYRSSFGSLYLDEELALQIDFSQWPDAELITIDVLDKPMDGQWLPCDPPEFLPDSTIQAIAAIGDPIEQHHLWPRFLGGENSFDPIFIYNLRKSLHTVFHNKLRDNLIKEFCLDKSAKDWSKRQWESLMKETTKGRYCMLQSLRKTTYAFDKEVGTNMLEGLNSMLKQLNTFWDLS
jgi:hypothetical protein